MPITSLQGSEEHIFYSAITFRRLLDCFARPGKLNLLEYPTFLGDPPTYSANASSTHIPLNLYALGALLTLLDGETRFAMSANGNWLTQTTPAVTWLALRSGALVTAPADADFAFFCDGSSRGLLTELNMGTLLEPEISATAIYCVAQLTQIEQTAESIMVELTGPGIQEKRAFHVVGLAKAEIQLIQATRRSYPLGIDIYLVDTLGRCVGLPRTTRIEVVERLRG